MDLQDAREQLAQMLTELDATVASQAAEDDADEAGDNEQNSSDAASDLTENDREQAMREAAAQHRTQVVAALGRLDDGTYGTCIDCGKTINEARLQVRPEASRCVECQAKAEAA
ncbi:MAG: TraR/DksA C4-type zinc finger protein [Mycobacteriales bacterium]